MNNGRRRSGFTLPEILVTVTVIAVLAAAVVPAVTQYVNKGNTPASQQDVQQLRIAVTAFTADTRRFPGDLGQLTHVINTVSGPLSTDGASPGVRFTARDSSRWQGPYTSAPIDSATATFSSAGLAFTIGRDIVRSANWLTTPIAVPARNNCAAILALDKALDGLPASAGVEGTTGSVVWTNGATPCSAATATTGSTVTNFVLRLVPAN
jgi:prepilin-type N-terminal cleavage/methylation domain-containing protein